MAVDNTENKALKGSSLLGIGMLGASLFNKKRADAIDVPMVDTLQAQALADVYRKSQAINTGADFAAPSKEIEQTQAAASDAIVTAAGGDAASEISGILKAQRQAGAAKAQIAGQGMQQRAFFTNAFLDMSTRIAQRKLELQLAERSQARLESAQYLQDGMSNLLLGGNPLGKVAGVVTDPLMAAGEAAFQAISPLSIPVQAATGKDLSSTLGYEYKTAPGKLLDKATNTYSGVAKTAVGALLPMAGGGMPSTEGGVSGLVTSAIESFKNKES